MAQHEQCPQLQDLPRNIQQFWEEKQQECGEQVIIFSYAVLLGSSEAPTPEKSGILYLMERNLWFEDFPKPPFFLFNRATTYKKTLLQIPRTTILTVELIKKSGFEVCLQGKPSRTGALQKLFTIFVPDPVYLRVVQRRDGQESDLYYFRELNEPEAWIQAFKNQIS
ncbi:hypothetical protein U27_00134 [Candidatus Vecturithrix granuli]|uniref:Uncharacterized protein n=1 Tax=Vecturithrix granuli TaxID=1499967 RepID=A0A081C6N8_VECG1|nr:hypothetical protein U27_00134 [Candidatus Vecturithrix granuli]